MATHTLQNESAPSTREPSTDRAAWDRAVAYLRAVQAEYDLINPQHTAAFGAAEAICPREGEFYSRYGLGWYEEEATGRERNFYAARTTVVAERSRDLGRALTLDEAKKAAAEARGAVDQFEAHLKRRDEVHAQYDCDGWENRFDAVVDRRWKAQNAVLRTKAPDQEAMLFKLELLAGIMDGEQDQQRVIAIRDDARRLLAA